MENRAKKIDQCRKRSLDAKKEEPCIKKCMLKARRKLVFEEKTEGRDASPERAEVQRGYTDFEAEMQFTADRCRRQYNFDIIEGEAVNGPFNWQVRKVTRPTNLTKCGEPRHSLVH